MRKWRLFREKSHCRLFAVKRHVTDRLLLPRLKIHERVWREHRNHYDYYAGNAHWSSSSTVAFVSSLFKHRREKDWLWREEMKRRWDWEKEWIGRNSEQKQKILRKRVKEKGLKDNELNERTESLVMKSDIICEFQRSLVMWSTEEPKKREHQLFLFIIISRWVMLVKLN